MDFEDQDDQKDIEEIQDGDDFFDDADLTVRDSQSKKDAVIFLVDCKECLFDINKETNTTSFNQILVAFQSFLKSKIISSVDDMVGLIFYNVKNKNNQLNFDKICEVYSLENPSADRIKECLKIEQQFERDYQIAQGANLHECLWLCNHSFKSLDRNKFSMRIFLFTPDDLPYFRDQNARDQTIKHARQLKDMDVQIELFPLPSKKEEFRITRFFSEIITLDLDEINNSVMDTTSKIMDLTQRIKQKEFKKRALNRLLMDIDDVQVGLKIYCLINKAKKPYGKPIERKTNQQLKKKQQFMCAETGNTLYPNQIGTHVVLGNEKIPIPKEHMAKIKGFEKPGMKLIGFKSIHSLKDFHNYRTSYFLYPDDEHVNGSSQFFDALIEQMIVKEKLGIVRLVPKVGSQVRFCALLAQKERFDEDHFQIPPGLHLVFLPYADDIRGLNQVKQESREVSRQTLNAAKIMVNALTIQDFDCANFEDPSLQKFYTYLQGHAIHEENIEEPEDLLQPDYRGMEKYRDIVDLFVKNVSLECTGLEKKGRGATKGGSSRGRGRGRGKMEEECQWKTKEEEADDIDGEEFYEPPKKKGRGRGKK